MHDASEFEAYVAADGSRLLRVAYLMVGDRAEAEDLVQVCLLRVLRRWNRIDGSPHPYARAVLARLATDRWRRLHARPRQVPLVDEHLDAADPFGAADVRQALVTGLRALPARQRAALVLRYFEGLSEAETAATMGVSSGTVKTHTARGLAALRASLATADEGTTR